MIVANVTIGRDGTFPGVRIPPSGPRNSAKKVSPELQSLVLKKLSDPRTSARDLLMLAEFCDKEGAAQTATALRARAGEKSPKSQSRVPDASPGLRTGTGTHAELADAAGLALPHREVENPQTAEPEIRKPSKTSIPGVTFDQWIAFEKAMVLPDPEEVEKSGRLGIFAFAPKRLIDLGIAREVNKSPEGKWTVSKWSEGWSKEKFLGNPAAQAKAFRRSMREYARSIEALYKDAIGKKVHNKVVTLSGLLAVAHVAGGSGLSSWIKDKAVREKFPLTTKVFLNTSGMF